jgi:hypothetical protein
MAQTTEEKNRAKRERARLRRGKTLQTNAVAALYPDKPIEEWDNEELAHGRPRNADGSFTGTKPAWITRQVHEEAVRRFTEDVQSNMRGIIPTALITVQMILESEETDKRGRPVVPYGVKLDAAKWVVEHLVGKPTQRVEADISVRLQGMLANVMVTPQQAMEMAQQQLGEGWIEAEEVEQVTDED